VLDAAPCGLDGGRKAQGIGSLHPSGRSGSGGRREPGFLPREEARPAPGKKVGGAVAGKPEPARDPPLTEAMHGGAATKDKVSAKPAGHRASVPPAGSTLRVAKPVDTICDRKPDPRPGLVSRSGKRRQSVTDKSIRIGAVMIQHLLRAGPQFAIRNHRVAIDPNCIAAHRSSRCSGSNLRQITAAPRATWAHDRSCILERWPLIEHHAVTRR